MESAVAITVRSAPPPPLSSLSSSRPPFRDGGWLSDVRSESGGGVDSGNDAGGDGGDDAGCDDAAEDADGPGDASAAEEEKRFLLGRGSRLCSRVSFEANLRARTAPVSAAAAIKV